MTVRKYDLPIQIKEFWDLLSISISESISRGAGTGGAGGAIAPPTFVILHSKQPLAPPTFLFGSVNSSTTNFQTFRRL